MRVRTWIGTCAKPLVHVHTLKTVFLSNLLEFIHVLPFEVDLSQRLRLRLLYIYAPASVTMLLRPSAVHNAQTSLKQLG